MSGNRPVAGSDIDIRRSVFGGLGSVAAAVLINRLAAAFLGGADFGEAVDEGVTGPYFSFYDGCVLVWTLAAPAFLGGLALAAFVREAAWRVSVPAFAVAALVGFVWRYWRIPIVSPASAHNGLIHYMTHSPLVLLAFGTLGAWVGSEFASGRFTLQDPVPIRPGPED
ncbi:MAG: hypothetical protein ACLQVD_04400 [Capsulimonadaceae bacterium]